MWRETGHLNIVEFKSFQYKNGKCHQIEYKIKYLDFNLCCKTKLQCWKIIHYDSD